MLKMGSVSISGASRIGEVDVVYFNASYSDRKNASYSITKSIENMEIYTENKAQCDEDYAKFERKAMEIAREANLSGQESDMGI